MCTCTMTSSRGTMRSLKPRPTTFSGLPPELILSICDFLPRTDLICLSLCNRRIFGLSQRQVAKLPHTHDDKVMILTRLERDLPQYFHCEICNLLHQYDETERFVVTGPGLRGLCQLPCVKSWKWAMARVTMQTHVTPYYSLARFSYLQLKLAMRRVYKGPSFGINTDYLSFTQVCRFFDLPDNRSGIISLFSMEARVCQPLGLYIRMQDIMISGDKNALISDQTLTGLVHVPPQVWQICPHDNVNFRRRHVSDLITPLVESFQGEKRFIKYTCEVCDADATIEIAPFDSKIALIMTRWVNLGLGLTQDDIMWTNQVDSSYWDLWKNTTTLPDHLVTHPRLCFEDMATEPFEKLRSRNLSYLKNHQYQTTMTRCPAFSYRGNLWFTWHKLPPRPKKLARRRARVGFCDTLRRLFYPTRKGNLKGKNGVMIEQRCETRVKP